MKQLRIATLSLFSSILPCLQADTLSLDGPWGFALDPQRRGEKVGWQSLQPATGKTPWTGWDTVTVPHCWSGDPRYEHTGAAWYLRSFEVPAEWTSSHLRLRFSSVGDRCRVWLNGQLIATHDGANLPFSADITHLARRSGTNVVALEVDNSYNDETIPSSRPGSDPKDQLYPWWNYGGILGPVTLEGEPAARIVSLRTNQSFAADGSVKLEFRTQVENRADTGKFALRARLVIPSENDETIEGLHPMDLAAASKQEVVISVIVPATQVKRWRVDHPVLYPLELRLEGPDATSHSVRRRLGLREISIRNAQLLLNGEPVKLAGANRARGHQIWKGLEPRAVAEQDMGLMKDAHLEFSRLQHQPISEPILDWADEHGMLIIAEAGNWQFSEEQLSSPTMRKLWMQHTAEMIENMYDRPSVIGWSVGNEYPSWTQEGIDWTRDMAKWIRTLDASRPITFAALGREMRPSDEPRERRSPHYVDFVSVNYYGGPGGIAGLDRIHALWPDKPIMVSEYGLRADKVANEQARIDHFLKTLEEVRKRPFICGLSYWSFNDYLSRYPDTGADGYRAWGIVTGDRTPRDLYAAMRTALNPMTVRLSEPAQSGSEATLEVTSRADFPSMTLRGYTVQITSKVSSASSTMPLPELIPGASAKLRLPDWQEGSSIEIRSPDGRIRYSRPSN